MLVRAVPYQSSGLVASGSGILPMKKICLIIKPDRYSAVQLYSIRDYSNAVCECVALLTHFSLSSQSSGLLSSGSSISLSGFTGGLYAQETHSRIGWVAVVNVCSVRSSMCVHLSMPCVESCKWIFLHCCTTCSECHITSALLCCGALT